MKSPKRAEGLRFLLCQAAVALLAGPSVHAADGTWNVNASGTWSTSTNWLSDIVASGSGSTAYFTNDITADRTVTLDGPRTLTNVVFGDSDTATAGSWTIFSSSTANTLALAGSTPTITVNALGTGATATISANVTGTNGLTKDGVGTLVINKGAGGQAASFPSGALTVNSGTLRVNNTQPQSGATNLLTLSSLTTINNGSALIFSKSGTEGRVLLNGGVEFGASGGNVLVNANSGTAANDALIVQSGTTNFTTLGGTKNVINSTGGGALTMQNASLNRILNFNVADGTDATDLEVNIAVTQGGIRKSGAGVLTLTRANTSINYLDITAGTLELAGAGTLNGGSTSDGIFSASFVNNGTLLYAGTNAQTLSGSISGSGNLTKSGTATLTLSGSNSFGGGVTVRQGTLSIATINDASANGVLGNSATAVTLGSTGGLTGMLEYTGTTASSTKPFTAATGGTAAFTVTQAATTLTLSGAVDGDGAKSFGGPGNVVLSGGVSGAGDFFKTGTGVLTLASNSNTYTGATGISAGTLKITGAMAASAYTIDSGATLDLAAGSVMNSGAVTFLGSGTLKLANSLTFGGTADKTVSMSAGGLIWVTGSSTVQGSSSQRGEWAANQASLQVDAGSTMNFVEAGNTGVDQGIGVDALTGSGTVTAGWNGARTLFIGVAGGSGTFSGILANHPVSPTTRLMAVTKQGAGRQVLSGANTYTGATSISAGVLEIGPAGSINSTSGISVNGSTAEFKYNSATALAKSLTLTQGTISGTGTIGAAVAFAAGDYLSPGNSPGEQAYTSLLTWSPLGTYQWELNALTGTAGTNWDFVNVSSGTFDLSGLSATPGDQFVLDLITLDAGNAAGALANPFDGGSYTFPIASYNPANFLLPTGFSNTAGTNLTSLFTINLGNWQGAQPQAGNVSVKINSTATGIDLVIVPEPGTLVFAGIGIAMAGWALRNRRRAAP